MSFFWIGALFLKEKNFLQEKNASSHQARKSEIHSFIHRHRPAGWLVKTPSIRPAHVRSFVCFLVSSFVRSSFWFIWFRSLGSSISSLSLYSYSVSLLFLSVYCYNLAALLLFSRKKHFSSSVFFSFVAEINLFGPTIFFWKDFSRHHLYSCVSVLEQTIRTKIWFDI